MGQETGKAADEIHYAIAVEIEILDSRTKARKGAATLGTRQFFGGLQLLSGLFHFPVGLPAGPS
ncbi:MAG: hypothetical protein HKN30_16175 [Sulfitobacter sp.]|nr:hypothetical protein [Sulfitobacter sp.]